MAYPEPSRTKAQRIAAAIPEYRLKRLVEASLEEKATLPQQVRAFHELYNMPIVRPNQARTDFGHITKERLAMRFALIAEEFMELCEAMDVRCEMSFLYLNEEEQWVRASEDADDPLDHNVLSDEDLHFIARTRLAECIMETDERNVVEVADACADLKYVIQGFELEVGIPSDAVLAEVHASNCSKLGEDGNPIYREDGKVMKGPNYFKANIASALSAHGMRLNHLTGPFSV